MALERLGKPLRPGMPGASGGKLYLKGMEQVMSNLNKEISEIKSDSVKGLLMAAAFIRNKTEKSMPLTPVDLGNLRSSWFITSATKKEANDQYNKGFRTTKVGKKKIKHETMTADHIAAISEAQSELTGMNTKDKKFIMMGYSASYAGFVHEFVGEMMVNFKREGSGAKWLESAIKSNTSKIVQIVKENAQIKG